MALRSSRFHQALPCDPYPSFGRGGGLRVGGAPSFAASSLAARAATADADESHADLPSAERQLVAAAMFLARRSRGSPEQPPSAGSPNSDLLVDLLDAAWFASEGGGKAARLKPPFDYSSLPRSRPGSPRIAAARPPRPAPVLPPLDMGALRREAAGAGAHAPSPADAAAGVGSSRSFFSGRSRAPSAWDSPRSFVSTVAELPRSEADLEGLSLAELRELADESALLRARAEVAERLARGRLGLAAAGLPPRAAAPRRMTPSAAAAGFLLEAYLLTLAVAELALAAAGAALEGAWRVYARGGAVAAARRAAAAARAYGTDFQAAAYLLLGLVLWACAAAARVLREARAMAAAVVR